MPSILIIDDEEAMRTMVQQALSESGYQAVTAANGEQAAAVLARAQVDLVLTDVLMPQKDGLEVLQELHRTRPSLPVVVMSGGGHLPAGHYLSFAQGLGAKGILQKPFSKEQLLVTIALALLPARESTA